MQSLTQCLVLSRHSLNVWLHECWMIMFLNDGQLYWLPFYHYVDYRTGQLKYSNKRTQRILFISLILSIKTYAHTCTHTPIEGNKETKKTGILVIKWVSKRANSEDRDENRSRGCWFPISVLCFSWPHFLPL